MSGFSWGLICIMGLCWGSFINVIMERSIIEESIINPPSHCPKCNNKLLWWHKIPILSYFILKGKCYFCSCPISIQNIIMEAVGLIIWVFAFKKYISLFDAIAVILILSMFVTLSWTDIKKTKINTNQTYIIGLGGLIFNRFEIWNSVCGCIIGALTISALIFGSRKILKKDAFGIGDIYLIGSLGAVVGADKIFLYLMCALILAFLVIFPKYIYKLYITNQIKTLKSLIYFGVTCLFLYVFRNISFFCSNILFIIVLGILLYFAYKLMLDLFNAAKKAEEQSYLPIAPFIGISCLIFLFISSKLVINIVKSLETTENVSHCPLAPAVAISCLLFLC